MSTSTTVEKKKPIKAEKKKVVGESEYTAEELARLAEDRKAHCVIAGRHESIKGFVVSAAVLAGGLTLGTMYVPAIRRVPWRLKLVGGCMASVAYSGFVGETTMTNCRLGRPY